MDAKVNIREIAKWQLDNINSEVKLPTVQRGFVWNTKQIEDLWDSILRGFPIGSFLFSRTSESAFFLLDGQQRATAIAAGFYNPYINSDNISLWSIKGNLPTVWIDINPNEVPDRNLFLIRAVTRSHPWGYSRRDSSKILISTERDKALKLFRDSNPGCQNYTDFSNRTTFPFDSYFPIPLIFFLNAKNSDDVIEMCDRYLPENIKTSHSTFKNKEHFIELLCTSMKENVEKIFKYATDATRYDYNYDLIENQVLSQEEEQEEPTLFVRINSSGTPLNGNDLIYSIYKSLFPKAKDFIENIAPTFIAPTLNIALASRIVYSMLNEDSFPNKMSVKEFQRNIKNPLFKDGLSELIGSNNCSKYQTVINLAIEILSNPSKDIKLPPILVKNIINKSPDIFLFLLYWLFKNEKLHITDKDRIAVAGAVTYFQWFGSNNRKLTRELWQYADQPNFWRNPINKDFFKELTCLLLPPTEFRDYLISTDLSAEFLLNSNASEVVAGLYNSVFEGITTEQMNEYYEKFFGKLFWCKSMVLFTQRNYLEQEFCDYNQFEDLEDTNAPWDWDHIYPISWVYRKQYVNENIKKWVNSIGNFRILSFGQNRSESNLLSPSERLDDLNTREISFVKEQDWHYWSEVKSRIWDDNTDSYTKAIKHRMANIYSEWWETLRISDIFPYNK